MDESGNTGSDLLNADQPLYVLSAVVLDENKAEEIFNEVFGGLNGEEVKLKSLFKRRQFDKILKTHDLINEHGAFYSFILDKKYMALGKFLDDCIEPIFHRKGLDFYKNGFNTATMNLLSIFSRVHEYEDEMVALLKCYLRAVRSKEDGDIDKLFEAYEVLYKANFHDTLPLKEFDITRDNLKSPSVKADLTFPAFSGLMILLENKLEPYQIVHDHSTVLSHHLSEIYTYQKYATQTPEYSLGHGLSLSFPLKAQGFKFMDSKDSKAVQLADIVSGSLMRAAKSRLFALTDDPLFEELLSKYKDENIIFRIHNNDVAAQEGPDSSLIDQLASILQEADN